MSYVLRFNSRCHRAEAGAFQRNATVHGGALGQVRHQDVADGDDGEVARQQPPAVKVEVHNQAGEDEHHHADDEHDDHHDNHHQELWPRQSRGYNLYTVWEL